MTMMDRLIDPDCSSHSPAEFSDRHRHYKRLEEIGIPIEVPKNYELYAAGDLPDSCYLVKEGRIVSFEHTYTGRQHVFGRIEPGDIILLPSIILGHRLTLSFATTLPSKLVRIQRNSLFDAMSSDIELALCITYILSAKFIEVNERLRASSSRAVPWKLCNLLLSLADKHGVDYDGKVLIEMKASQQMMADYLHVNRTTVARTIKELTCSGLIERINDYYCIRSLDKLKCYMDDIDVYESRIDK